MKAIGPLPEDAQMQIDFGGCRELHGVRILRKMTSPAKEKIIVALDAPDTAAALKLADALGDATLWVKIGLQLFTAEGPDIVRIMKDRGYKVFLDLKFHDIPNTAREAVHSAVKLGADMTTIHLSGGQHMIREAVAVAADSSLLVLGVTVLTSFDEAELHGIGVNKTPADQVENLVTLGTDVGLRGVVSSPHEISTLRARFGNDLTIVTPGVRPAGTAANDQQRVMIPGDAIKAGASYLVIGRPITGAASPREAMSKILQEVASVEG